MKQISCQKDELHNLQIQKSWHSAIWQPKVFLWILYKVRWQPFSYGEQEWISWDKNFWISGLERWLYVQYRAVPCWDLGWSWANIYGSSVGWLENTRMSSRTSISTTEAWTLCKMNALNPLRFTSHNVYLNINLANFWMIKLIKTSSADSFFGITVNFIIQK